MPQVISSISEAAGRGVFIIFKAVLDAIKAVGTGRAAMVAQLPWGPPNVQNDFSDAATFRSMYAPAGMPRTSAAYLMATKFPWIDLQIVRVTGTTPVKATFQLQNATPANSVRVDALYEGAAGNAISLVVAAATSGTANNFKLTVSVTDSATGLNTTETYDEIDTTQVADDATHTYWAGVTSGSLLIGALVRSGTGRPVNGTYTLATGSDGAAIASGNYLGTPGNGDAGVSLLENDSDINFVFTDDPGAGNLVAVMAGLKAHVLLMKDRRISILMGLPGETKATAVTNVALNRDTHCVYVFPHCKVLDDQGATRTIPLTGPLASLATLLTPHLSVAFKSTAFTKALANIIGLDVATTQKQTRIDLEKAGVVCFEKNPKSGQFSPYNDITTDASGASIFQTRMADYIAFSMAQRLEDFRGGPNDDELYEDEDSLIKAFLLELKTNRKQDHIFRPCIIDYQVFPLEAANTAAQIAAGDATHSFKVQLISERKRTFLLGEIGTAVKVTPSAA
jgi:hypothetical protein